VGKPDRVGTVSTADETQRQKRLLLVVGVGRSGTSLCAGVLGQLGFRVPQPEVATDETNPRGFSEPQWVVDFHRRLMSAGEIGVFDSRPDVWRRAAEAANDPTVHGQLRAWLEVQFVGCDEVVVKDPRIGWFLDLWLSCAAELGLTPATVTMLRHPTAILSSARRSYGDWQNDASRATAWINGMLGAEHATRAMSRAFVRYDDLLADWDATVRTMGAELDIPRLAAVTRADNPAVDAFIDPTLQRSTKGWADHTVPASVEALAERVWDRLTPLAGPADGRPTAEELDRIRAEYAEFYGEAEAIAQSSISARKSKSTGSAKKKAAEKNAAAQVPPAKKSAAKKSAAKKSAGTKSAAKKSAATTAKLKKAAATSAPSGASAARSGVLRVARLAPASLRNRVPTAVRRRVLRVLAARRVR
jgi:hypothetical protein